VLEIVQIGRASIDGGAEQAVQPLAQCNGIS